MIYQHLCQHNVANFFLHHPVRRLLAHRHPPAAFVIRILILFPIFSIIPFVQSNHVAAVEISRTFPPGVSPILPLVVVYAPVHDLWISHLSPWKGSVRLSRQLRSSPFAAQPVAVEQRPQEPLPAFESWPSSDCRPVSRIPIKKMQMQYEYIIQKH